MPETNLSNFKPSYLDRIIARVDQLAMPYWLFYILLFFAVGFVFNIAGWLQGFLEPGIVKLSYFVLGTWIAENLFINHFLIASSLASLNEFKSQIGAKSAEFERLKYSISHVPSIPVNLWSLIGISTGLFTIFYMIREQIPISDKFPILYLGIGASIGASFFFAAGYRAVRQLRIISQLLDSIQKVNLHDLGPIYGLALFPTKVVFVTILFLYINPAFILFPEMLAQPLILLLWGFLTLSSLGIAIFPLRGISQRLREEKDHLIKENGLRLDLSTKALYKAVDEGEHNKLDKLERGINALIAIRNDVDTISTWPWKKDTIRWLATALVLPLGLWIIQFLLQRFLAN